MLSRRDITAGVCGVLCLSSLVMWARSGEVADTTGWVPVTRTTGGSLTSGSGHLRVCGFHLTNGRPATASGFHLGVPFNDVESPRIGDVVFQRFGFVLEQGALWNGGRPPGGGYVALTVPYWLPTFLTGLPVIIWLARRPAATMANECSVPGFDVRATPDRCPECGTAATPKS